ncbi:uncharacterized [Tachysurus ichikawai]
MKTRSWFLRSEKPLQTRTWRSPEQRVIVRERQESRFPPGQRRSEEKKHYSFLSGKETRVHNSELGADITTRPSVSYCLRHVHRVSLECRGKNVKQEPDD